MQAPLRLVLLLAAALCAGCGGVPSRGASSDCVDCHARKTLKAEWARPRVHEPFKDEAGCDACHKRHGQRGENVLAEAEPGLCLRCHDGDAFQRGKLHSAVQLSGCSGCHQAHAGDQPKLLRASREAICGQCHTDVTKQHGGYRVDGVRCAMCHDPHSSSNEKLLREVTHEVLADCTNCHAAPGKGKPFTLSKSEPALCYDCHSE